MAINFSLGVKTANPGKRNPERKVYATAQYASVVTLERLAERVARRTAVADRAAVAAVVTALVDGLCEELLEGNRVELGELGDFFCVINGTGAESVADFSVPTNITGLSVRWRPGRRFLRLHSRAVYHYVPRRESQAQSLRADREELGSTLVRLRGEEREEARPERELSPEELRERRLLREAEALVSRLRDEAAPGLVEERDGDARGVESGEGIARRGEVQGGRFGETAAEFGETAAEFGEKFGETSPGFGESQGGDAPVPSVGRSTSERILAAMRAKPDITLDDLTRMLGVTKRTVEKQIRNMRECGLIVRHGSDRRGTWHVSDPTTDETTDT